jgi:GNAT superfamily N-acetyltransferase
MVIRKATAADIDELVRVRLLFLDEVNSPGEQPQGFAGTTGEYFTRAMADGSVATWLAEEGGQIAATSSVCYYHVAPSYHNPDGAVAYIFNVFTLPQFRRRGLGAELFGRIVDEAKGRGYRTLALHATREGRRMYEKFGFEGTDDEMVKKLSL